MSDITPEPGHLWKLIEPGPPGHDPPWGDWYECSRCNEGCRHVGPPPVDKLVFDGLFTCEQMLWNKEARLRRLKEKTSRPGWDGPRSSVVPSQRWEAAEGLLVVVARETNAPPAFVSPGGDGSIHIKWANAARSFTVEFADDGMFWSSRNGGAAEDGETDSDVLARLKAFFV